MQHKYQKVTEVLNKNFHRSNPGKYPHLRHAKAVYEKHKNMMNRYKQEQKKKEAWDARKHAAENRQTQTGSATGEDLEDFQSDWHCYDDFFQYCVGGNPADEGQQDAYGHVRQSSLQQQADTTTPGQHTIASVVLYRIAQTVKFCHMQRLHLTSCRMQLH